MGTAEGSADGPPFLLSSDISIVVAGVTFQQAATPVFMPAMQPLVAAARAVLSGVAAPFLEPAQDGSTLSTLLAGLSNPAGGSDGFLTVPTDSPANSLLSPHSTPPAQPRAMQAAATPVATSPAAASPAAEAPSLRVHLRFAAALPTATGRKGLMEALQLPETAAALAAAMAAALRSLESALSLPPGTAAIASSEVAVDTTSRPLVSSTSRESAAADSSDSTEAAVAGGAAAAGAVVIALAAIMVFRQLRSQAQRKAAARSRRPLAPLERRYSVVVKLGEPDDSSPVTAQLAPGSKAGQGLRPGLRAGAAPAFTAGRISGHARAGMASKNAHRAAAAGAPASAPLQLAANPIYRGHRAAQVLKPLPCSSLRTAKVISPADTLEPTGASASAAVSPASSPAAMPSLALGGPGSPSGVEGDVCVSQRPRHTYSRKQYSSRPRAEDDEMSLALSVQAVLRSASSGPPASQGGSLAVLSSFASASTANPLSLSAVRKWPLRFAPAAVGMSMPHSVAP